MRIKVLKYAGIASLGLSMLVVAFSLVVNVVEESDHELKPLGYDTHYRNSPLTGLVYSQYSDGSLKRLMFFLGGKKVGTERIWYPNGMLMVERPYWFGQPDGEWRQWYQDGSVKSLKVYTNGIIDGESWGWHSNGQISDYNRYEAGREISHKSWVFDGTPYYNYVYQDGHKVGIRGGDFCKRLDKVRN